MSFSEKHFLASNEVTFDKIKSVFEDAYFNVKMGQKENEFRIILDGAYYSLFVIDNHIIFRREFFLFVDDYIDEKKFVETLNELCLKTNNHWLMVRFSNIYSEGEGSILIADYFISSERGLYLPQLVASFKKFTNVIRVALTNDFIPELKKLERINE